MAFIRPFKAIRPVREAAARVAALPYDVYSREEARKEAAKDSLTFLRIDRPETFFPPDADMYSPAVYEKAAAELRRLRQERVLIREEKDCYYLYELTMGGHIQTGIVALSSADDYLNGVIRRHENTRAEKEEDRVRHVDVTNAQTGPIFLAYRGRERLRALTGKIKGGEEPLYDFVSADGVRHRVFRVDDPSDMEEITAELAAAGNTYIADGHHRAASAVRVAGMRREQNPGYDGTEEFNYFLSVLFADDELQIFPYNRYVRDLNGLSPEEFFRRLEKSFRIRRNEENSPEPKKRGDIGMYLHGRWYMLTADEQIRVHDPVEGLDVSLLQREVLGPILGIRDPRISERIAFVGGIRGTEELERLCEKGGVAFAMRPTSMEELLSVADAGLLMPPKSTWFEPKLRSGLFIHSLDQADA